MKEREIVYEVFLKTFYAGDKEIGQIKGITEKLDYLKDLGITQIWITPFYVSDFEDSGYDVIDYCKIDQAFGTMEDFCELILESKKRDIKIMIDLVLNHCSNKHKWFKKALSGDKKYQDYFFFKKGSLNGPPNNWISKFGGPAWTYLKEIDKYYLHLFTKNQLDLNWENKDLQDEILSILNFWIKIGVKGFRFDVCNLYSKAKDLPSDKTDFGGRWLYTNGPKIHEYLKMLNLKSFGSQENFLTVGEMLTSPVNDLIEYVKKENNELEVIFDFHHLKVDHSVKQKWIYKKPDLEEFKNKITEIQNCYQEKNCLISLFLNNHDQPRSVTRFGDTDKFWYESATAFAVYIFLQKGIPFIYQGEELGMTNYPFLKNDDYFDVETKNNIQILRNKNISETKINKIVFSKARDHARTAMQWNNKLNAGFSLIDTDILINPNYQEINVESQIKNKKSILNLYKLIFSLRKKYDSLTEGKIIFVDRDKNYFGYKRIYNGEKFLILANLKNSIIKLDYKFELSEFKIIFNNYDEFKKNLLKEYQALIFKKVK